MGYITDSDEDLAIPPHPAEALDPNDAVLAIGDLHGNAMKAIHFLISEGVMTFPDDAAYRTLLTIYKKNINQLTRQDLIIFKTIIDNARINKPQLLILIGDELADRGNNDWFMLLVLNKLNQEKVPYRIQLSNHSMIALQSFAERTMPVQVFPGQQTSINNLWALISSKLIGKDELLNMVPDAYQKHLALIGYIYTEDSHLTLFTHAPAGLETVKELAIKFAVPYNDSTVENLIDCIDKINHIASTAILSNRFSKYFNVAKEIHEIKTGLPADPLARLFWARELHNNFTLTPTGPFTVSCVHGHIGPGSMSTPGVENLDSMWGKQYTWEGRRFLNEEGICPVFRDTLPEHVYGKYLSGIYPAPAARSNTSSPLISGSPIPETPDLMTKKVINPVPLSDHKNQSSQLPPITLKNHNKTPTRLFKSLHQERKFTTDKAIDSPVKPLPHKPKQ